MKAGSTPAQVVLCLIQTVRSSRSIARTSAAFLATRLRHLSIDTAGRICSSDGVVHTVGQSVTRVRYCPTCMSGVPRIARPVAAVLAAVLAVVATAACAAVDDGDPAGTFTPATPGVLTVASNLPAPGFWEGPASAPTGGFEHGLAVALADRFGLDSVVVVDVPFERIVAGDLGGADLALAELTPTDERDGVLDFTTGYLDANPAVIVRPGSDLEDMAAARELTWVVQEGSTQEDLVTEVVRPELPVATVATIDAVVAAVLAGDVDAGLLDLPTALVEQQLTDGGVVVAAQFGTDDVLAIAVPEGSDDLEALDSAVRGMLADGTVESLADEWLGRDVLGRQVDVPLIRSRSSQITD